MPGRKVAPDALHRFFYRTRLARVVDRLGHPRFRHWRVYGERGLAGERAASWLYEQTLTVECRDEVLAQYRVTYQADERHHKQVDETRLFETPLRSPQPLLWALGDGEWLKVLRRSGYGPRPRRGNGPSQERQFP